MSKQTVAVLALLITLFGAALALKFTGAAAVLTIAATGGAWLPVVIAAAALVDSVNPCAFSVLIITIGFLMSLGRSRRGILAVGGTYIAGLFTVYTLIGLGILQALTLFGVPHGASRIGALILIAVGALDVLGQLVPNFPVKLAISGIGKPKIAALMTRATYPAAFALGVLVGLFEFPCTGGPYLFVLGLLHDSQTYLSGLGYLVLYNLIFVLPLVMILTAATTKELLTRVEGWKKSNAGGMRVWGGVAMIALGFIILVL